MSELAYIHPDAKIGKGTKIDPFVTIEGDVEIGENCWIGSNSVIFNGARIGNNVQIGGGSGVIKDITDDSKVMGFPSKDLKKFIKRVILLEKIQK